MECSQCGIFVSHKDCIPVLNEWNASHPVVCSSECLDALKREHGARYIFVEE